MDKEQQLLLARVNKARAEIEERQDAVLDARATYIESVRRLYESGMPLRDIANELGLSHQRVHQMVNERVARRTKVAKKAAKGAAGIAIVVVVAVLAIQLARADGNVVPPSAQARLAQAPAQEYENTAFFVRGFIAERHPELKTLTGEEVTHTSVTGDNRLRVEWDGNCSYFSDWMQTDEQEWMLTGAPSAC